MFNAANRLTIDLWNQVQKTSNTASPITDPKGVAFEQNNDAIVTQTIAPDRKGQVKFQGSWWTARCNSKARLRPGALVQVIHRQNLTLYVEPVALLLSL